MFIEALLITAKLWNSQDAPLLMNGLRKCGVYTQMEFYSATKKNEIFLFAGKRMKLENIIFSEVSQAQKAKSTCFLSYLEYRPNTNAAIL
jgi:hypothetical protein